LLPGEETAGAILFMVIFGLIFFIIMVVSELFIMFGQVATYAQIAAKRK
jgi:hypothetical protein